ncbi:MAG: C40 family peptidase [bacterium]|nr:NlpC/P60 family protein [bacterium]
MPVPEILPFLVLDIETQVQNILCPSYSDQISFRIKKGEQIAYYAQYGGWLHYPYHYGGKGSDQCSGITANGLPADRYYNHEPFSNDPPDSHPSGGTHHYCCFDCSGFSHWIYSKLGLGSISGSAASQQDQLPYVGADKKKGDLIFYGDPAHHVTIYIGGGQMAAAPSTGDWTKTQSVYGTPLYEGPSGWGWDME